MLQDDALTHSLSKEALTSMLGEIGELNILTTRQADDNKKLSDMSKKAATNLVLCQGNLSSAEAELITLRKQLGTIEERELKCAKIEIRNEYSELRGDEHRDMLKLIFANRTFRESVMSTYPVSDSFSNSMDGSTSSSIHRDASATKVTTTEES